jgi:hypothetical protein
MLRNSSKTKPMRRGRRGSQQPSMEPATAATLAHRKPPRRIADSMAIASNDSDEAELLADQIALG